MPCQALTPAEVANLIAQGCTVTGPYNSLTACLAVCQSSSSSFSSTASSLSSSSSCCPLCNKTPNDWDLTVSGGTGIFSILNGFWNGFVVDGYNACNPNESGSWILQISGSGTYNGYTVYVIAAPDGLGGLYVYAEFVNQQGTIVANAQYWWRGTGCTSPCCGSTQVLPLISQWTAPGITGSATNAVQLNGVCS